MKANLTLLSLCLAMSACVYHEELADVAELHSTKQTTSLAYSMQHTVKAGETDGSRSIPNEAFAHVQFYIKNEMPDLQLTVESIRLCNIHLSGTYHFAEKYWETDTTRSALSIETGKLEVKPNEEIRFPPEGSIPFIPQAAQAWNPTVLPQQSNGCYLMLKCKVGNEFTLWGNEKGNSAEAAIPLSVHFLSSQPSVIVLTLAPNCPWYDVRGTSPQPLFVPITFDVKVEDWEE